MMEIGWAKLGRKMRAKRGRLFVPMVYAAVALEFAIAAVKDLAVIVLIIPASLLYAIAVGLAKLSLVRAIEAFMHAMILA